MGGRQCLNWPHKSTGICRNWSAAPTLPTPSDAYGADLREFLHYLSPPETEPPAPGAIDLLTVREWLASLYNHQLSAVTIRRKLAAVRGLFRFLLREGLVTVNVARLVRTPKAPKKLPEVMSAEQANALIDGVPGDQLRSRIRCATAPFSSCSTDAGCASANWRGSIWRISTAPSAGCGCAAKGRKERQVPMPGKAAEALERYLAERPVAREEPAVFLNHRGGRLSDRGIRGIVKFYATFVAGDPSIHPHSFRHAYATHLLADGADLRAIQELLGHARLSTTQKYTQVALTDLIAVYDKAHPKA